MDDLMTGSVECFNWRRELVLEDLNSDIKLVSGRGQGECLE